jgi:hypothetical protein
MDDDEPADDDGSAAGVAKEAGVLLGDGDLKRAIPATLTHFRTPDSRTPGLSNSRTASLRSLT